MVAPPSVIASADLRGNEYAWKPNDFPAALEEAARLGFRCIGGQFQFRIPGGTLEMYWLKSDAPPREPGEAWSVYVGRCAEKVRGRFDSLLAATDFLREAESWTFIREKIASEQLEPLQYLVFVAYFENEHGEVF